MVTHSSMVAWEIPWTEETDELVYRVTRVRQDLATSPPPSRNIQGMSQDNLLIQICPVLSPPITGGSFLMFLTKPLNFTSSVLSDIIFPMYITCFWREK